VLLGEANPVPPGQAIVHFANSIVHTLLLRILLAFPSSMTESIKHIPPRALLTPIRFVSDFPLFITLKNNKLAIQLFQVYLRWVQKTKLLSYISCIMKMDSRVYGHAQGQSAAMPLPDLDGFDVRDVEERAHNDENLLNYAYNCTDEHFSLRWLMTKLHSSLEQERGQRCRALDLAVTPLMLLGQCFDQSILLWGSSLVIPEY
jgi:hypothetical protein